MMTLMISHLMLQQYWWIIISLLAGILVFLMFVQGGQSLIFSLPGTDLEKSMIINALGRKWEFTFTTLVTFGGTFFASFPLFYATSFGGAYWVWTIILFSFIIQAVSYEYRSKAGNILGKNTFDAFLMLNGAVGPFLLGTALSTFFTGAMFSLDEMKQVTWHTNWYGLEALTDFRNLSLGFATLFLVKTNGLLFLINTIDHDDIRKKSVDRVWPNSVVFLIFFLYFIITLLLSAGFSYEANGIIMNEKFKYLHNFLDMPIVLLFFLAGVAGVLYGIFITLFNGNIKGIWFSGPGTALAIFSLFMVAGFNRTAFYPSVHDTASSLTIVNASSSLFTLRTMMVFSLAIPFIFAYIWYAWKALTSKKITEGEISGEGHKY